MPFDEEELDPHGECAAEIKKLRKLLVRSLRWVSHAPGSDAAALTREIEAATANAS